MKWIVILVLCLVCIANAAQDEQELKKLQSISLNGLHYYQLSHWAELKKFRTRSSTRYFGTNKTEEVWLSNHVASVVFRINSRRMDINQIAVWLSYPIILRGRDVLISKLDVQSLLQPLLFPAKTKTLPGKRRIVLDPGHGGKDPGNQVGEHMEKTYTLLLAKQLQKKLQSAGYLVYLTRTNDTFIDLEDRVEFAQRKRADIFISLHFNSTPGNGNGVRGVEVYCLTPAGADSTNGSDPNDRGILPGNRQNDASVLLAYHVQKALVTKMKMEDRGMRRARWSVLRTAAMPAILIEGGFMSDPSEAKTIFSNAFQQRLAQTIFDSIQACQKALRH